MQPVMTFYSIQF